MEIESQSTLESSTSDEVAYGELRTQISQMEILIGFFIVKMLDQQGIEYFEPNVVSKLLSYIKFKAQKYLRLNSDEKIEPQDVKLSIISEEYKLSSPSIFYKYGHEHINEGNRLFEEKALQEEKAIKELNRDVLPNFSNFYRKEFNYYKPENNGNLLEPNFK